MDGDDASVVVHDGDDGDNDEDFVPTKEACRMRKVSEHERSVANRIEDRVNFMVDDVARRCLCFVRSVEIKAAWKLLTASLPLLFCILQWVLGGTDGLQSYLQSLS